jgi:uncharacterized phage-like protein YoqJ
MKHLVTGHRVFKLKNYDMEWIKESLVASIIILYSKGYSYGLSGMASGVDLWYCESCFDLDIPYAACIPFEEQTFEVEEYEVGLRKELIEKAAEVHHIRNSRMVEMTDAGIVVWDGNKGGTHNVVQQLVENSKPFIWINPVSQKIWECI